MLYQTHVYHYGRCSTQNSWLGSAKINDYYYYTPSAMHSRLYYIYGGTGWYWENGQEKPFQKGHLYFIPAKAPYHVRHLPEDPIDHLYCDFAVVPFCTDARIIDLNLQQNTPDMLPWRGMVEALNYWEQQPKTPICMQAVQATVTAILMQLHARGDIVFLQNKRIEQALERIHATRSDGVLDLPSIRDLAQMLHLDENYFIRIFRKEMGLTPYQYILNHRLDIADSYIENGYSVSEAARLAGYESTAALNHAFRRHKKEQKG